MSPMATMPTKTPRHRPTIILISNLSVSFCSSELFDKGRAVSGGLVGAGRRVLKLT